MKKKYLKERVLAGVEEGKSCMELCAELGVSVMSLKKWLVEWGVECVAVRRGARVKYVLREEDLRADVLNGLTRVEIAEKYDVPMHKVHKELNRLGLVASKKSRVIVTERDEEMKRYRGEGMTLQEIGDKVGLTREGVRISLKKMGVEVARNRSASVLEGIEARARGAEEDVARYLEDSDGLIRSMVWGGLTAGEIMGALGESRLVVRRELAGFISSLKEEWREERGREMKSLYEDGYSLDEVGVRVGVSNITVLRTLRELGVERRKGRRSKQMIRGVAR